MFGDGKGRSGGLIRRIGLAKMGASQDGPAGVFYSTECKAAEAQLLEMLQCSQSDGLVIGVDEGQGAVVMITENVDYGNALVDQLVGTETAGFVVDARNDTVDAAIGSERFDMRGAGNTAVQRPIPGVVVDVPMVDFTNEFGDAAEHITTRRNGGFDFEKDLSPMTDTGILHEL